MGLCRYIYKLSLSVASVVIMKKKLSNNTNNSAINSDAAVDWTNEEKVREYTEKVFLNKFQINVTLPNDRLCPPLPNRLNYITWLNHLIQLLPSNSPNLALNMNMFNPILPEIRVLDIGTGVSCVYPILGTKLHGWKFLASDIDPYAIQHVNHTLSKNSTLQSFILPVLVPSCERIQQLISERYLPLLLLPPILDSNSTSQTNMDGCEYSSVSLRSLIQEASQSADPDAIRGPIRAALSQSPWASIVLESEQVFLTNSSSSIVSTDRSWSEPVMHACMCNPPFFDLDEEV